MAAETSWVVVVPVKELHTAKSRLVDRSGVARADLALAMVGDVVSAAIDTPSVAAVLVVTNDLRAAASLEALGARIVADVTDSGLNDALSGTARLARVMWPRSGICALSGDLPCADAATLAVALDRAAEHPRAVLPDRRGDGTTMLTAGAGCELAPRYGVASRSDHLQTGARQLDTDGLERLRLDVDTPADLDAALLLGVGPRTTAAVMLTTGEMGTKSGR